MIEKSRNLPNDLKNTVNDVIQHNGFFAHPENLLIAMVTDPSPVICTLSWRRKKNARSMEGKRAKRKQDIRNFVAPQLNFEAAAYHEMIDWSKTPITEPPLLKHLTDEELDVNIRTAAQLTENISFPCHTQAVERLIRLVSEASEKVFGHEARENYVRAKLQSREEKPEFETKRQYVTRLTD